MIAIVNPNNRILSPYAGVEPPLWAGLIASDLRGKGENVAVIDAEAENLSVTETAQRIKELSPKQVIIVVMGNNPSVSSTPKMVVVQKLIPLLDGEIFLTGLHPSALKEETEKNLGIKVLTGKIFEGMPAVAWDLLPMHLYRAHNWHCLNAPRQPYGVIYTSLGCPFSCSFCNIHALYQSRHIRFREPQEIVQEIDTLVNKYHVVNIKIWDELFTLSDKHVEAICKLLIERKYDLNIWAYARVDRVSPPLLDIIRRAGITWLAYGFESGCDTDLAMLNKHTTTQKSRDAVKMTHETGINVIGNFLFGLSHDTLVLPFAQSLELEYINFYVLKRYPGCEDYSHHKWSWDKTGVHVDSAVDWTFYSQFYGVHEVRDKAFNDFFSDPEYLARIERKFGTEGVENIKAMLNFGKPRSQCEVMSSA